jgi:hypothetical protein
MAGYCPQQGEPERNKLSAPSGIGWKPTPVIENPLKRVAIGLRTGF